MRIFHIFGLIILSVTAIGCQLEEKNFTSEVPVRAITQGPEYHWFGYYDKWQFDTSDRYVLGMEVDFEHRSPRPDDTIKIGMVDLQDGDRWIELGETRAWNWQQGCMLQWLPGSENEIIWNDRVGGKFVSHILNVQTRDMRTIPSPVYTVSPDGRYGLAPDFVRIQNLRPGYGYAGIPDPNADVLAPENAGIYKIDLQTGSRELIISIAQIAAIPFDYEDLDGATHYFNHLLFSRDGQRFIFLHRWRHLDSDKYKDVGGFGTRMLTADINGGDIRVVDKHGYTSHFIWRDPEHILAWTKHPSHGDAFYLFRDSETEEVQVVGKGIMDNNGHCTYLPGNEWILNDTYPDAKRMQHVYLYHVKTGEVVTLGKFYSPPEYMGETRVDTHPRYNRDGTKVVIDSPHDGNGRQLYLLDIAGIL